MTTTPTAAAPTDRIEAVRAFNRFYTARIGALRDGLLATPYPLPEARILFELGRRGTIDAADLRRVLDLDGGYLSRLLARLEAQDLVARERSADDGRRQPLELTAAGRAAYATLDERSAAEIGTLLDELDETQRTRLLTAMDTIREVLDGAPQPAGFVLRPPRPGDLGWVVHRHGTLYAEHGWDTGFEALVARVVADYAIDTTPPARPPGSPTPAAAPSARSSACATTTRPHSCACCSSSRARAGWASDPRSSTPASPSPARPATAACACGPRARSTPRAGSTSARASGSSPRTRARSSARTSPSRTGSSCSTS